MTDTLARLRRLHAEATPEPWNVQHEAGAATTPHEVIANGLGRFRDVRRLVASADGSIQGQDDASFIAEFRNHAAALLDIAEAARKFEFWYQTSLASASALDHGMRDKAQRDLCAALARLENPR